MYQTRSRHTIVEYYDPVINREQEVLIYFSHLPRRGDILTIRFTKLDNRSIRVRVCSIEHIIWVNSETESQVIIKTESP